MNIKKVLNENVFTAAYTGVTIYLTSKFINSEEGRANLMETFSLGMVKYSFFLITIFMLTKMLAGIDKDLKQDLFATPYTTTATWCTLILSLALLK